jgi:methyl-accepting chemotaxis protein
MALQIGDATRQRIEHVGEALGLLHALLAAPSAAATAKDAWWNSLGENEHNIVIAEVCRLQAAQLSHAAQEFETEVAHIVAALRGLSGDAGAILRLGSEAYGTSNQRRATFLGDLEENVTRALTLLRDFRGAHDRANRFAGSVHDSVMRSSEHIETVRSLEVDLRLLGLNMTLKCNRLGEPGRALSTIAQELRDCADRTTDDARIVMSGLDSITKIADQMRAGGQAGAVEDFGAVEDMMTRSVHHFGEAGQDVAKALVSLARDGEVVAKLLDETAARINFGDEICRVLRQGAAELDRIGRNADNNIGDHAPAQRLKDEIQSKFGRRYTMESERAIHQQLSGEAPHGNSTASPSLSVEAAQTSLEDILF